MMQAGLHPHTVMVMFDPKFPEAGELAIVFGFQAVELESSTKYICKWELIPYSKVDTCNDRDDAVAGNLCKEN